MTFQFLHGRTVSMPKYSDDRNEFVVQRNGDFKGKKSLPNQKDDKPNEHIGKHSFTKHEDFREM